MTAARGRSAASRRAPSASGAAPRSSEAQDPAAAPPAVPGPDPVVAEGAAPATEEPPAARRDSGPTLPASAPRPVALGLAFVLLGFLWFAAQRGLRLDWGIVLPAVIVAVGVLLLLGGRHVRVGGVIAVGLIAAAATLVLPLAPRSAAVAVGDRAVVVTDTADLESVYAHGVGELVVDLSGLELPPGTTFVDVELAVGEATVIVPPDVAVTGSVALGVGEIEAFGTRREGLRPTLELDLPGSDERVLELGVRGLVGEVEVRR
jgi:hypothetical protein